MRPSLQVQLWLRRAPRWQVGSAGVAIVAVLALLAASFRPVSPASGDGATSLAGSGGLPAAAALPTSAAVPTGAPGAPAGGVVPGRTGRAGAAGGAQPGAAVPGAAAAPGVLGRSRSALTASDRGVTPTSITLGFSLLTLAGLEGTPVYEGFRKDSAQYVQALVSYQNAHGGVDGRKLRAITRKTDPLSRDDQIQACTQLTQDDQVFSVIDPTASIYYYDAVHCFTQQNGTPLIHQLGQSYTDQARTPGYDISTMPVYDRDARDLAAAAKALKVLTPGEKVGILIENCEPEATIARDQLAPALKQAGASAVELGPYDCTLDGISQVASIVTQFKLAGVSLVVFAASAGGQTPFQTAAARQNYKPKYFESDWYNNASDTQTQNYDPNQFDGTKGVSAWHTTQDPVSPQQVLCSRIATAAGLAPVSRAPQDAELLEACDSFFLWVRAATLAGPDLTRKRFAAAVQSVGQVPAASVNGLSYAPGKFDGASQLHYVQWHRDCTCWRPLSGWFSSVTLR